MVHSRKQPSPATEASSGEDSQSHPELSIQLKRKTRYMEDYRSHLEDEDQRKLPEEAIQQQTAPENYVVTPHRKRRPGFHNAPAQNPPFVPFSPSYIDEISYRHHRNNQLLSSSAPPFFMDNSSKTSPQTGGVLQMSNTIDEIVVKYRPPSEEGHTLPPSVSPRPNYQFGANSSESSWGPWALCQPTVGQPPSIRDDPPPSGKVT